MGVLIGWCLLFFYYVEHLEGGLDGGFGLVGVESPCAEDFAVVAPGDDGLDEGVGASSGWDGDGVVGQHGEGAPEGDFVYLPECADEGVVLSVAAGAFFILSAVDAYLDGGHGLEAVGEVDDVALELDAVGLDAVFEHVADDVGEVFLGDEFFLVAQLDDACGDLAHGFFVELESEVFEVLAYVGLAAGLPERVLALAAEAFGKEVVAVEVVLIVPVGMHACHLGEDVLADDGLVGWDGYAGVGLDEAAGCVELLLVDVGPCAEMVLQDGLDAGEGCVAGPLSQPVDGGMQSFGPAEDGCEDVADGEVVVVVRMEVEVQFGVALLHLAEVLDDLERVEYAQRVGKHEAPYARAGDGVHEAEDVVG